MKSSRIDNIIVRSEAGRVRKITFNFSTGSLYLSSSWGVEAGTVHPPFVISNDQVLASIRGRRDAMGRLYAVQFITNTGASSPLYGSSDSKIGDTFAFDTNGTDQILRIQCAKAGAIDAVNAIPANKSVHLYIKSPELPPKTIFLQTSTLAADLAAVRSHLGFEIVERRRNCSVECDGRFDVLALENIRGWQALESELRRVYSEHIDGEQVTIHVKPPPHTVDAELAPIECVRSCKRRFRLSDCSEPQFDVGPRIDPRGQVYSVRHKHVGPATLPLVVKYISCATGAVQAEILRLYNDVVLRARYCRYLCPYLCAFPCSQRGIFAPHDVGLVMSRCSGSLDALMHFRRLKIASALSEYSDDRNFSDTLCVRIAFALLTALQHLHALGITHRRVQPSSVLFLWTAVANRNRRHRAARRSAPVSAQIHEAVSVGKQSTVSPKFESTISSKSLLQAEHELEHTALVTDAHAPHRFAEEDGVNSHCRRFTFETTSLSSFASQPLDSSDQHGNMQGFERSQALVSSLGLNEISDHDFEDDDVVFFLGDIESPARAVPLRSSATYTAPEALIAHDQTTLSAQSGDIWSAGVLLLQLCSRRSANCFEQPRDLHALLRYDIEQQRMGALDVYRSYSDSYFVSLLADIPNCVLSLLVLRMLIPDPALRPSASECLKQLLELPGVAEIVSSEPSRAATQTALQLTDFAFSDHL